MNCEELTEELTVCGEAFVDFPFADRLDLGSAELLDRSGLRT